MKVILYIIVLLIALCNCTGYSEIEVEEMKNDVELIKKFEGFRSKSYRCSANKKTVGYGTTIKYIEKEVMDGDTITKKEAERQLILHLQDKVYPVMDRLIKVELNANQRDALASFIYNVGEGNFSRSTLLKVLNDENFERASFEISRFVYANKKISNGLVKRRKQERELFDTPIVITKEKTLVETIKDWFNERNVKKII